LVKTCGIIREVAPSRQGDNGGASCLKAKIENSAICACSLC